MEGTDRDARPGTATDPDGVVHDLATPNATVCGQAAGSWSRAVTALQAMGLVTFCKDCAAGMTDPRRRLPAVGDVRSFHLLDCPARDVAERRITAVCTCPAERFLDPWAEPIPEMAELGNDAPAS